MKRFLVVVATAVMSLGLGCGGQAAFAQGPASTEPTQSAAQQATGATPVTPATPATAAPVPTLSVTETTAIGSIAEKLQKTQSDTDKEAQRVQREGQEASQKLMAQLAQIEAEIVREHPGYHFDRTTGGIVKDAAPVVTTPAAKSEKPAEKK